MDVEQLSNKALEVFTLLDKTWEGYEEQLTEDDFHVAVAAMVDYLDGIEGPATIELPNADLKVQRDDDGQYHLWVRIGDFHLES